MPVDFTQVPFIVGNTTWLADIWSDAAAGRRFVDLVVWGDSQEDAGSYWCDHFHARLHGCFGNTPATPYLPSVQDSTRAMIRAYYDTAPASRVPSDRMMPGYLPGHALDNTGSGTIVQLVDTHGSLGFATILDSTPHGDSYFPDRSDIRFEGWCATNASSGELAWEAWPTGTDRTTVGNLAFESATASGTTTMGLNGVSNQFRSFVTPTLPYSNKAWMQVNLKGTSATPTDYLGGRFLNYANKSGFRLSFMSEGGNTANRTFSSYPNGGAFFRFMPKDFILWTMGANEMIVNNADANTVLTNILNGIDTIRSSTYSNDPNLKIVLRMDPIINPSGTLTSQQKTNYSQYAWAAQQAALQRTGVIAINTMRLAAMRGFNFTSSLDLVTSDKVHDNDYGGALVSAADLELLLSCVQYRRGRSLSWPVTSPRP